MDGLDRDFAFLVASARRVVAEAAAAVATVSRGRSSKRGAALSAHVEETLRAIENRIGGSEARFSGASDDVEREAAIETMRLINSFLSEMQEATPWVEAGANPGLELGPLYVVDESAAAIAATPCDVVAYADAKYQYATVSWPFQSILQHLGQAPTPGPRPVVIFYPPGDAHAFLLHALFSHELGHSAVWQHNLVDRVLATTAGDATWTPDYNAAVTDVAATETGGDLIVASVVLQRQLRRWVTELLCDDFGAHYSGPAYLWAFAAVVVAMSWNEPQDTHPPTTTRVAFLLRELDELGWSPTLSAVAPEVLAWLNHIAAAPRPATNAAHDDFLTDVCERLRPAIRTEVRGVLGSNVYQPATYSAHGDELEELLADRIMPAQLASGAAVDRRNIYTTGWAHVFRNRRKPASEGDASASVSAGVANAEYQEFLAKAAEMSRVLETWDAV